MTDQARLERFLEAWTEMVGAYLDGDVRGALGHATQMEERFPERRNYLRCLRASALAVLGDGDRALGVMRDAVDEVRLAVDGSLAGAVGFVAVVGAPEPASLEVALPAAAERGVRGFLLAGGRDQLHRERMERLHAELGRHAVPCRLETVPGLGHQFPADFPERLAHALDFVLDERPAP